MKKEYYLAHRKERIAYQCKYVKAHVEQHRKWNLANYHSCRSKLLNTLKIRCSNPDCTVPRRRLDPRCLHIDHRNGDGYLDKKRFNSYTIMVRYYSKHPEEAKLKLQMLCANCHVLKTYANGENKSRSRE